MLTFTIIASALILLCLWQHALTQIDMDYNYGYSFPTIIFDYVVFGIIWLLAFFASYWLTVFIDPNIKFLIFSTQIAFAVAGWYSLFYVWMHASNQRKTIP